VVDSRFHYFFSEAGNYDRVVIQELLKEIAQTQQVDVGAKQRFKGCRI
jgi:replication factor C subunit 3/5